MERRTGGYGFDKVRRRSPESLLISLSFDQGWCLSIGGELLIFIAIMLTLVVGRKNKLLSVTSLEVS